MFIAHDHFRLFITGLTSLALASCVTPDTQVGRSSNTGASYGALAGLVFGDDLGDVVEGAAVGGLAGAAVGSAKASEQAAVKTNKILEQESQRRAQLERERLDLEQTIAARNKSGEKGSWMDDKDLLTRAFGKDAVDGLLALRDCKHDQATIFASAADNSANASHQLAAVWLRAMIATDARNQNAADTAFARLVELDPEIQSIRNASDETNEALTALRGERRSLGISCSG